MKSKAEIFRLNSSLSAQASEMFAARAATTNAVEQPNEGLTLDKILRAKRLLEENKLPPDQTPDHYAARQSTLDALTARVQMVKDDKLPGGNFFHGIRIVIDETVPPGCLTVRTKDGYTLAICGGIA